MEGDYTYLLLTTFSDANLVHCDYVIFRNSDFSGNKLGLNCKIVIFG